MAPCSDSERVVTRSEPGSGSRFAADETIETSSARRTAGARTRCSRAVASYSSIFSISVAGAATKNAIAIAHQLIVENERCAERHAQTLAPINRTTSETT